MRLTSHRSPRYTCWNVLEVGTSPPSARLVVAPGPAHCAPAPREGRSLTGDVRLLAAFHSDVLATSRDVLVYLPPGYDRQPLQRYPVLYLHDGQNIFDASTSYVGEEWGVDETAECLIDAGLMAPAIIVAVNHGGAARAQEFAPTRDGHTSAGGHADRYAAFLVTELKPFIDDTYRTLPGAAHTAVGGSSLGGLITLHLGLRHPKVFGALAVMSPSLWWDRRAMLMRVAGLPGRLPWRIWLDVGTAEGRDTLRNARALSEVLQSKGWVPGEDLRYVEAAGATHSESAWAARIADLLVFLFPASPAL